MDIIKRNNVTIIEGDGPTIIYAHGFGCNKDMWRGITSEFEGKYRQVLFDYVGSGQSDLSAFDVDKYSKISGYTQDILDVCEALKLTSDVIFVGHSVSCSAGILASLIKPDLFRCLILVGPTPCFLNQSPEYLGGFESEDLEELLALMDQNFIGWANYLAPVVAGSEYGISGELSESFCSTDPLTAKIFARTTFFADNRAEFKKIVCPSLILQHKEDALVPLNVGSFMQKTMANNTYMELNVKGHCAHMSHPNLVVAAIDRYLNQLNT